jgi:hypothetical protein
LKFGQKCPILPCIFARQAANCGRNNKTRYEQARPLHCGIEGRSQSARIVFRVEAGRGKGGHAMVYVGDKLTTIPSREIDPKTARKIRKQLGLE